jgi:hypothetical protein
MSEGQVENTQPVEQVVPKSLEEVIAGLKGFGIEEFEEILVLDAGGQTVKIRISNIPSEDEMAALMAVEGVKGYLWVQKVKCEIISRAISWIDGVPIRKLTGKSRFVTDPTDGIQKDIQVVLRNLLLGWGQEIMNVLWKVVCVHSQRIEERLASKFPDSAVMTDVEKRFLERALRDIDEHSSSIIASQLETLKVESEKEAESEAPTS